MVNVWDVTGQVYSHLVVLVICVIQYAMCCCFNPHTGLINKRTSQNLVYVVIWSGIRLSATNTLWATYVIMVVADVLVPNRRQEISNRHDDPAVSAISMNYFYKYTNHVAANERANEMERSKTRLDFIVDIGSPHSDPIYDRLISTMGFPILVRWHLYIESGPVDTVKSLI